MSVQTFTGWGELAFRLFQLVFSPPQEPVRLSGGIPEAHVEIEAQKDRTQHALRLRVRIVYELIPLYDEENIVGILLSQGVLTGTDKIIRRLREEVARIHPQLIANSFSEFLEVHPHTFRGEFRQETLEFYLLYTQRFTREHVYSLSASGKFGFENRILSEGTELLTVTLETVLMNTSEIPLFLHFLYLIIDSLCEIVAWKIRDAYAEKLAEILRASKERSHRCRLSLT